MPHREVMDGVLVIFGGAFLITPGFITDILGVLLAPAAHSRGRHGASWCAAWAAGLRSAATAAPGPADYDVEGTAHEYDDSAQRRLER